MEAKSDLLEPSTTMTTSVTILTRRRSGSASFFPAFCKVFPREEVKPDPAPACSVCCELLQDCPLHHNAALAHSSHCRRRVGGGDHQARAQRCLLVLVFPLRIIFKGGSKINAIWDLGGTHVEIEEQSKSQGSLWAAEPS